MLIYMHFILILEDGVLHRKDNHRVKALWVTTLASHTLCITTYTGNSSCNDHFLLLLKLCYHAHDRCVIN